MYWLVSSVLAGEVILFLVFMIVDRGRPRRVGSGFFYFALCIGLFTMAGTSFWAYLDTLHRITALDQVTGRYLSVCQVLKVARIMETSERGYLLTDRKAYLEQYHGNRALMPQRIEAMRRAYQGSPDLSRIDELERMIGMKVEEMDRALAEHRKGEHDQVIDKILTGYGKSLMDLARASGEDLQERDMAAYHQIRDDLHQIAKARISMALVVIAGAVIQMLIGAVYGWPASHTLDPDRLRECPA